MDFFVGSLFLIIFAFVKGTATSSYVVGGELLAAWTGLEVFLSERCVQCWSEFSSSLRALPGMKQEVKVEIHEDTKPIANLLHIIWLGIGSLIVRRAYTGGTQVNGER